MRCIAHRGFAADAPENTIQAVQYAAVAGADAVEVDVRASATGEPVVVHDATVDRVTDGSGAVDSFTPSELARLDVLGSGEGVPTLADLVGATPDDVDLVLELKETGLAAAASPLVSEAANEVIVSSFLPEALHELTTSATDIPRALLVSGTGPDPIGGATQLGCSAVHLRHDACDETVVQQAHESGLALAAWTVETAPEADRLETAGVDGVIADTAACCRLR